MISLRTAALGAAMILGIASAAAAQGDGSRRDDQRGERRGARGAREDVPDLARHLFQGIELSDKQQGELRTIQERYRPQFATLRESMRPQVLKAREARKRGDTEAARAAMEETADEREAMQSLTGKLHAEAREVLTAEQRKTFDANIQQMREKSKQRTERRWGEGRRGEGGRRQ